MGYQFNKQERAAAQEFASAVGDLDAAVRQAERATGKPRQASQVRSAHGQSTRAGAEYSRVRLALALLAALVLFVALWLLNGFFTARSVLAISALIGTSAMPWSVGWLVHIIITLLELAFWPFRDLLIKISAPRGVLWAMCGLAFLVGAADVLSSAVGFLGIFHSGALSATMISTALAEAIAVGPEPIVVWLLVALWRVVRT